MTDAIISINPRHAEKILTQKKTVELRTKGINLPIGSRLWIYTTLPIGRIKSYAEIDFIEHGTPTEIWRKHGRKICISKREFDDYTSTRNLVTAIGLKKGYRVFVLFQAKSSLKAHWYYLRLYVLL